MTEYARRIHEMGKVPDAGQNRLIVVRQQEGLQKLQKDLFKLQLQNVVKQQLQQQQEMANIWRDLMKIENETLIRKMNDPNPLVSLLAIQVAGKKRLSVEKECIGQLSNPQPMLRQAARQTLVRLGRGVDFGPELTATGPQIGEAVQNWNAWIKVQSVVPD